MTRKAPAKSPDQSPNFAVQNVLSDTFRIGISLRPNRVQPFVLRHYPVCVLDEIPKMSTIARTSLDVPLTWITSMCLLHERLEIGD